MSNRIPSDAFDVYFSLGPKRSYRRVADHFGVSERAVAKRAAKDQWPSKLERIELEAHKRSEQNAIETVEEMNQRHMKVLRAIQGKALETLRSMPLDNAMDAVRALDIVLKQERVIRGEPTERTAVTVEETIKREYERWMTRVDGDDSGDSNGAPTPLEALSA